MVKNPIKVFARLKPEKNRKGLVNYQILHRTRENVEEDVFFLVSPSSKSKDGPDNRPESWNFSFARIFEEATTQAGIFENVAQPVVDSALYGYNGTIFAYGQTATGKTYSITGRQEVERRGIIPRSLQYLFEEIGKRPENVYTVEVAYLEIYNETGYDLLDRGKQRDLTVTKLEDLPRISLMEDEAGRLHMKNLSFHTVTNVEEAFELLLLGDTNRIVVETPMNSQSSRSHCIFTILVSAKEFGADQYKRSKVHLVDLAGSERIYKCFITGTILTEAKHINLSLHYLEQVIVCLGQENVGHIPYRNSLLTSILRDSLGGNCLTTMLATISLVATNIEETLSTCRFAQRVALIRNEAKLNLETDIQNENALLRAENERLKQKIEELTSQNTDEELTADDKKQLDDQIKIFLGSNEHVSWDSYPKKVQYCFESIRKMVELNKDTQSCMERLEYYKDLVIQRDKEISLLIDMVKKAKGQSSTETLPSDNTQGDKKSPVVNEPYQKKQKRRPKVAKAVAQSQPRNDNRATIVVDKNSYSSAENVQSSDVAKSPGKDSVEDILTSRTISIDRSRYTLPSCSIVNLTLPIFDEPKKSSDESVNIKLDEAYQHSVRTTDQHKKWTDQTVKIKTSDVNRYSARMTDQQKKWTDQDLDIKLDGINQYFPRATDQQKKSTDRSVNVKPGETDRYSTHTREEKEKIFETKNSVRSTQRSNKLEDDRNLKELFTEMDYSIPVYQKSLNFNANLAEKSVDIKNDEKASKMNTARKPSSDEKASKMNTARKPSSDENCTQFDNLPLTGDPDIDEEIIAFYKAKRSGSAY